jgi:hypothetical protein
MDQVYGNMAKIRYPCCCKLSDDVWRALLVFGSEWMTNAFDDGVYMDALAPTSLCAVFVACGGQRVHLRSDREK